MLSVDSREVGKEQTALVLNITGTIADTKGLRPEYV